jgi:hypothetical protein
MVTLHKAGKCLLFFLIPPNSKEGSSSFGKRAVVEETEKWKTGEHQLITESLCWCFRGVLQFRQEWQVESSWWPSSPLTFPAGIFEEKSFGGAPEWHTSSLMVRSKKFSGRARRVRRRARPISCRQALPRSFVFPLLDIAVCGRIRGMAC